MELILIAVVFFGGLVVGITALRMHFAGRSTRKRGAGNARTETSRRQDGEWQEIEIDSRHPGSDWVYLPKVDKDNECKLVCISDMGHKDAVKPVVDSVVAGREYSLALEREPTNKYDPNAIRVLDNTDNPAVVIGYLPKHVSATLAERYDAAMPLSVIVKRAIKAPDGEVYLRLSPLIPKKSLRKHYELSRA